MGRKTRASWVGAVLILFLAGSARAQDDAALRKEILDLNHITGSQITLNAYKKLIADKDHAKKVLETATALAKNDKVAFNYNAATVLSLASVEMKDVAAADVFFHICADEGLKVQSGNRLFEAYLGLIEVYDDAKRYEDSERVCRELLELKTDDGKPRIVMYPVVTRLGETDFAVDENGFDTTSSIRPGIQTLMIQAITRQGKTQKALKLIDDMLKVDDSWSERKLKGWVLNEAGDYTEAAKTYEDVLERISKDRRLKAEERDAWLDKVRYTLSNVYVEMKQIDKASDHLKFLLEKHPDDPGFNNDLGYIWADHNMNLQEAEKLIRKALDLDEKRRKDDPNITDEENIENGAYLDSLGWVLFKQNKLKEAKEVMLKAVEDKSAQHIEIFDHLGDVLEALGERQAALAAWHKGLDVVGDSRREKEIQRGVEKKIEQNK